MLKYEFVSQIEDLIRPEEYSSDPEGRRVRFRIVCEEGSVKLLGDAMSPEELERILEFLGPAVVYQMLCG